MPSSLVRRIVAVALLAAPTGAARAEPEVAMNGFACAMYRELAKEDGNVFFAPLSLVTALAMTAEGARGETARQMGVVLGLGPELERDDAERPYDWTPVHAQLAQLAERLAPKPAPPDVLAKLATLRAELDAANAELESNTSYDRAHYERQQEAQRTAAEINTLQKQIDPTEFRSANALWLERTFVLEQPYLDVIGRHYRTGGALPADFVDDPDGSRRTINEWVAAQTNRRIENLIAPRMIDAATRLVLTNAVYFLGEWLEPFDVAQSRNGKFRAPGGSADAKLMRALKEDGVKYAAFNADGAPFSTPSHVDAYSEDTSGRYPSGGFQLVELPYRGGALSMQVLLPSEPDGLQALEAQLSADSLARWSAALEARDVDVTLPKFRLELGVELSEALQAIGMKRAFVDTADAAAGAQFDGMSASPDPARRLYIGAVVHKAFVEVDEKGTEAAAATAVVMLAATAAPMEIPFTPQFVADRPFVFVIRDIRDGTVLFMGRLQRPPAPG